MRLATWNCQGGFHKKAHLLAAEQVEIAIIQECSRASLQALPDGYKGLWLAGDEAKGLGLMYAEELSPLVFSEPHAHWLVPIDVRFELFERIVGVWTVKTPTGGSYISQIASCLEIYPDWFGPRGIIAGDFNANRRWDSRTKTEHLNLSERLNHLGFRSAYHVVKAEEYGQETLPTFFQNRKTDRSYHIDYIYVHESLLSHVSSLSIGDAPFWLQHSDHCPVILTLH